MVQEAEDRLGYELTIIQGSYNKGVGQSAGTHDGGGALDLADYGWQNKVRVLRNIGFAAWRRPTIPGLWNAHIHAIAIGDKEMSPSAHNQVVAYYNGRDGLASNGPDPHPRPNPIPVFAYWRTFFVPVKAARKAFTEKPVRRRRIVKRIQRALNKKLGTRLTVDGIAGPATKDAFKRWENKLDYVKANAVPNKHSLRELGIGLFAVKD